MTSEAQRNSHVLKFALNNNSENFTGGRINTIRSTQFCYHALPGMWQNLITGISFQISRRSLEGHRKHCRSISTWSFNCRVAVTFVCYFRKCLEVAFTCLARVATNTAMTFQTSFFRWSLKKPCKIPIMSTDRRTQFTCSAFPDIISVCWLFVNFLHNRNTESTFF